MDKEEIIDILEKNKENIEAGDWNAVYDNMPDDIIIGEFTDFLIENDIDPSTMFKGEIPDFAFYECLSLTSITIPNSVTRIGNFAFYYCTSLTSITIPRSVTEIAESAFQDCESLDEIKYDGTKEEWEKVNLGLDWNYRCPAKITFLK